MQASTCCAAAQAFRPVAGGARNWWPLAENADLARLSWGDRATAEPLVTRRPPRLFFGDVSMEPPPGAFLQATRRSEQAMREAVAAWIGDAKRWPTCSPAWEPCRRPAGRSRLFESDKPSIAAVEAAARRAVAN